MTLCIPNYLPENKSYIVDTEGYSGLIVNEAEFKELFYIDEYNLGTEIRLSTMQGYWDIYPFGKSKQLLQ